MHLILLICGLISLLALDFWQKAPLPPSPAAQWPLKFAAVDKPGLTLTLQARGVIPMPADTPAAHASALVALPQDHPDALMAFWFAGSRESGPDVQIAASSFDRVSQQWRAARFVVNRSELGAQLGFGVRRLGNPVAWLDKQGRIHLFVVATGLGGWAAGRIVHLRQAEPTAVLSELRFEPVRVLPLSWLWGTSHLVRAMPVALADGGMVLPAYFELGMKYPVALRFDDDGQFLGLVRMSRRGDVLQPSVLVRTPQDWIALARDNSPGKKIKVVQTLNGGQDWSDLPDLPMNNPDASVAALALGPGRYVLAQNSQPHDRTVLDLSTSQDGLQWTQLTSLARGAGKDEFSYPSMVWADNSLWVSYSDQLRVIAWTRWGIAPP